MLRDWDKQFPQRLDSMFTAIQNVAPSQLADTKLFDFETLETKRAAMFSKQLAPDQLVVVNLTV